MFANEPSPPQQAPGIIDATLRYRELSIALVAAGVVLGALYGLFSSGGTTATGRLSLTDPRGSATFRDGSSVVDFTRYVNDRVDFATSSEVLALAAKAFPQAGTPGDIRGKCDVSAEDGGSVITISCTADDSATAIGTVDAVVAAYRQATEEQAATKAKAALDALTPEKETLQKKLDALKNAEGSDVYNNALSQATASRLNELEKRGTDIRTTQALFGDGTESYDSARVSATAGYLTNAVKYGVVGGIVGLIFAVITAWFRADRDPIADDAQDVAGWLDLPLLGEIEHQHLETDTINLTAPPDTTFQRVASNLDAVLTEVAMQPAGDLPYGLRRNGNDYALRPCQRLSIGPLAAPDPHIMTALPCHMGQRTAPGAIPDHRNPAFAHALAPSLPDPTTGTET